MKPASVILTSLPQADGQRKQRPAVVLSVMPPFNDLLVCGISTQLRHAVAGFDELITTNDEDFATSGLVSDSVIRLGFLTIAPHRRIYGTLGHIAPSRHIRLLQRLIQHLSAGIDEETDTERDH